MNQNLIAVKLDSVSINKSNVPEFVTMKVSQDLNLMKNMSTQWNWQLIRYVLKVIKCLEQTFENKSIAKDYQISNKWTDYKIFELKYGNT